MAFTLIAHAVDWQALNFVNEFVEAFNERVPVNESSIALDEVSIGDDIQKSSLWNGMQKAIEDQWDGSTPIYTSTPIGGDYRLYGSMRWLYPHSVADSLDALPDIPDWGDFCVTNTSMPDDGWRRATSWNPLVDDWTNLDDPMWSRAGNGHGRMQTGDIIGPWIFKDLQTALLGMKVRIIVSSFNGFASNFMHYQGQSNTWEDAADSYGLLRSGISPSESMPTFSTFDSTSGDSSKYYTYTRYSHQAGLYYISTQHGERFLYASELAEGCSTADTIKYYFKVTGPPVSTNAVFHDNGDPVVEDKYMALLSGNPESWSGVFGSGDIPATATSPGGSPSPEIYGKGYGLPTGSDRRRAILTLNNLTYDS